MRKGFFARLAVVNIRKNKQIYVPYILACLFNVAMLYMMLFINHNAGMKTIRHSGDVFDDHDYGSWRYCYFLLYFPVVQQQFPHEKKTKGTGTLQHSRFGKEAYQQGYDAGESV